MPSCSALSRAFHRLRGGGGVILGNHTGQQVKARVYREGGGRVLLSAKHTRPFQCIYSFFFFFEIFTYFNNLCIPCGARTHDPKNRSHMIL